MLPIRRDITSFLIFMLEMIVVWIIAYSILNFFRTYGIDSSGYYEQTQPINLSWELGIVVVTGITTGILYSLLEIYFDRSFFQKMSYGRLILIKTVHYFFAVKIILLLVLPYYSWLTGMQLTEQTVIEILRGKIFWVLMIYFLIISILVSFFLQISQKFGPGMLWKFFIGKYHHPKEEERIFLFIDLRSSTTIAEQLGHIRFSKLLQDCFFDLTDVISKHRADIYQYVGDEAILSWMKEKGFKKSRCIHAYFDFMRALNKRADYYEATYGLQPFFKAGIHMGKVTVAEVGVIKKEIAYHGDVLNTTARIQGQCNELGQPLLASEKIIKQLSSSQSFSYQAIDKILLRGKQEEIKIYGIQPSH